MNASTNGLKVAKNNNIINAAGEVVGHIYGGRYFHKGQPCGGYGVFMNPANDTGRVFSYKADAVKYVESIGL